MLKKSYVIASGNDKHGSCVVKITYDNKKYVIAKCKSAYDSLKRIENGLNAFIRGGTNNPDGLYFHFYNYIKRRPNKNLSVQVLLESESAYELLKLEHTLIQEGMKNKDFLNNQTEAYIPMYNDNTKAYGWIPTHAVLNFNNWRKKNK